jgi:hypothetical protein
MNMVYLRRIFSRAINGFERNSGNPVLNRRSTVKVSKMFGWVAVIGALVAWSALLALPVMGEPGAVDEPEARYTAPLPSDGSIAGRIESVGMGQQAPEALISETITADGIWTWVRLPEGSSEGTDEFDYLAAAGTSGLVTPDGLWARIPVK